MKKNAVLTTAFLLFTILVTVVVFKFRGSPVRYAVVDLGRGSFTGSVATLDVNDRGQILAAIVNPASEDLEKHFIEPDGKKTPLSEEFSSFMPQAINNRGQILGETWTSGNARGQPVIWSATDGFHKLEGLGGANIKVESLNDAGVVVGASGASLAPVMDAFVWSATEGTSLLPRGPRVHTQEAFDINDRGDIVGWSSGGVSAFLRTASGEVLSLGTIEWVGSSFALGCNNRRQVVGYSSIGKLRAQFKRAAYELNKRFSQSLIFFTSPEVRNRAFLWEDGQMHDLNRFIPSGSGWILIQAHSINDAGQIVGWGTLDGEEHAFLLTPISDSQKGEE
jgi:probable HAF family extracellular repeat protein